MMKRIILVLILTMAFSRDVMAYDQIIDLSNRIAWEFHKKVGNPDEMTVAVMEVTDYKNGYTELGEVIAIELTNSLVERGFRVLERINMEWLIDELKLSVEGLIDDALIKEIGRFMGADALVVGEINYGYPELKINMRLVKTERTEIIAAINWPFPITEEIGSLRSKKSIKKYDWARRKKKTNIVAETEKVESEEKKVVKREPNRNLIFNGDFKRPWTVGWKRALGDVNKGSSRVEIIDLAASESGKALHINHRGNSWVAFYQEVPVKSTSLEFSVSLQMKSWEGLIIGFSGTGFATIALHYIDARGNTIGKTSLVNYVKNPFADTPLIGVPRGPKDSNNNHFIKVKDDQFYMNYRINVEEEILNNLAALRYDQIHKIAVVIYAGANDRNAGCEVFVTDVSLKYKKGI